MLIFTFVLTAVLFKPFEVHSFIKLEACTMASRLSFISFFHQHLLTAAATQLGLGIYDPS